MNRSCADWQLSFWLAVDGDLPQDESKGLAEHLRQCPGCRAAVGSAARAHRVLVESTLQAPAASNPATRRTARAHRPADPNPWKAALIAAAVLFGILALLYVSSDPAVETVRVRRDELRREQARAEQARRAAEEKVAALRREQDRLEKERTAAPPTQPDDVRKKTDEAFEEIVRRRKEEEAALTVLKAKEESAKEAVAREPAPKPPRDQAPVTQAAVATLERADGQVLVDGSPAKPGDVLRAGQSLETVGDASSAVFVYPDKTRIEIGAATRIDELKSEGGKFIRIARGSLRAVVAKQPKDQPLIVASSQGQAKVLGTTLRIVVDPDARKQMKLEVEEGRVELRNLQGKSVTVESGFYAVAADGVELRPAALPLDEIVLLPSQVRLAGSDWRMLKDDKSFTGQALEGTQFVWQNNEFKRMVETVRKPSSAAIFVFQADADKDYKIWIHGSYRFKTTDHHGAVAVAFPDGRITPICPWFGQVGENAFMFDWFSKQDGYWWSGGNEGDPAVMAGVRFLRSGEQKLVLHLAEPIRIDAIWLSATQKTRPSPGQRYPASLRK